jgi:aryl-alcohol dehydrogenase-like predicted oxidoreductase
MEYRQHRGLTLSEIGVGSFALAGAYGTVDRGESVALLRRAHALAVTVFDTAGNYGDAEAVLGEAVRPFRDEVILATKVDSPEGPPPRLTPEAVRAAAAAAWGAWAPTASTCSRCTSTIPPRRWQTRQRRWKACGMRD